MAKSLEIDEVRRIPAYKDFIKTRTFIDKFSVEGINLNITQNTNICHKKIF